MNKESPRQVTIIPKRGAMTVLPRIIDGGSLCYYLSDDYTYFMDLQGYFGADIKINNLSGMFNEAFQEIKGALLESLLDLNKRYDSYAWWGGRVASKSTSATLLPLHITYFFCAQKLLLDRCENLVFIVDSSALATCLSGFSRRQGYQVSDYRSKLHECWDRMKCYLTYAAQVGSFSFKCIKNRRVILKNLKPSLEKKAQAKKRVVIRSWVTNNAFDQSEQFRDRNFGNLPQWLHSKGYEVWILPMFFNLFKDMDNVCAHMRDCKQLFLIPEHYLKFSDYVKCLYDGYKVLSTRVTGVKLNGEDVSLLVNEALREQGLDVNMCMLNLSCHMLKRLKQSAFDVDAFYYAFECNAPENQFVLSCRKYYPEADIFGFQHTGFLPNQLTYHLAPGERECHPLPDKVICSGPVYRDLYTKARFPSEILEDGPNLRFEAASLGNNRNGKAKEGLERKEKILLLPLTFSYDLAFELFVKVRDALDGLDGYKMYIRTHPLLEKKTLQNFLEKAHIDSYVFADEGVLQEWLPKVYAVISTGGTITILETVSFGAPVIRVIPDNTFYYDPFPTSSASDYPLDPVHTALEIRQQLQFIDRMGAGREEAFGGIAKEVLNGYFPRFDEERLKVFL